jgi:hypothetical protein
MPEGAVRLCSHPRMVRPEQTLLDLRRIEPVARVTCLKCVNTTFVWPTRQSIVKRSSADRADICGRFFTLTHWENRVGAK